MSNRNIFSFRKEAKPYEYPEIMQYREAIRKSRWDVEEFKTALEADAFAFNNKLTKKEQEVIKRALLAICQVEVSVKLFWGKLYDTFPKTEFSLVGATFAENEAVHFEAYSFLLELLGFNKDFKKVLEVPEIAGRIDYLQKYLKNATGNAKQNYTLNLALFSMFIENISLFSQFAIIKSFTKHKNLLKEIDSIIEATMLEETIHAQFGITVINLIKKEYPEWFDDEFYKKIYRASKKAYDAESRILKWIFEKGEIDSISLESLDAFIKNRFNDSITQIGGEPQFEVDNEKLQPLYWMIEDIYAYIRNDFFSTQSTNYTKFNKSATRKDLF